MVSPVPAEFSLTVPLGRAQRTVGSGSVPIGLRTLYRIYERHLLSAVHNYPMPRHIGIILDGNRRHARSLGITDPRAVYGLGARKLDDVLAWCSELRIPTVTLWVFSPENMRRSDPELAGLFTAIETKLFDWARDARIHCARIRVRAIGRLEFVPASTRAAIQVVEAATAPHDRMVLNIAIGYGGRQEIVDAIIALLHDHEAEHRNVSEAISDLSPDAVGRYLYTAGLPDPDLIIRTSGEVRLSGFMLWQSAHSEFYFADVNWPAFRKIDLLRAIRSYQQRQRRFGM